jgi:hypothetical protein
VFLHYVDQSGPFSEWKHDKRNAFRAQAKRLLTFTGGEVLRVLNAATSMLGKA